MLIEILMSRKLIGKKKVLGAVIGRKIVFETSQGPIFRLIEPEALLMILRLPDRNLGFTNEKSIIRGCIIEKWG